MTLDPSKVGYETQSFELAYDWRTLASYALGIGAKVDELDYLFEARGPKVYPSFAVVPAYPVLTALMQVCGGNFAKAVHSSQLIRVRRELPPQGVLRTTGKLRAMYDLKRMAQVVFETTSLYEGQIVYETEWALIFRDDGDFGGPKRPRAPSYRILPEQTPDFVCEETTSPEQALLYRLSGDTNPLHADPEFAKSVGFERGPILHGLCTFGFVCRAVVRHACAGNAARLKELSANFQNPVWPGEQLRTEGYKNADHWVLQTFADQRPAAVLGNSYAIIE